MKTATWTDVRRTLVFANGECVLVTVTTTGTQLFLDRDVKGEGKTLEKAQFALARSLRAKAQKLCDMAHECEEYNEEDQEAPAP